MSETFDRDEFDALANEFGGLAGWWTKENGGWSKERVVDALLRLYDQRHLLDGVEDSWERGRIALSAFEEGAMIDLAQRKFEERVR